MKQQGEEYKIVALLRSRSSAYAFGFHQKDCSIMAHFRYIITLHNLPEP